MCLSQIEVEGDSLKVIRKVNSTSPARTMFGHIIGDVRHLKFSFDFCFFKHVKSNHLAHFLTSRAVLSDDFDVWLEEVSLDLKAVFRNDFILQ